MEAKAKRVSANIVKKLLKVVDAGLTSGMGEQVPGRMCVEAAVCFVLGMPHGDKPECVDLMINTFKIAINDADWSSNASRAKGLRKLSVLQLDSIDKFDQAAFRVWLIAYMSKTVLPRMLRAIARLAVLNTTTRKALRKYADDLENVGGDFKLLKKIDSYMQKVCREFESGQSWIDHSWSAGWISGDFLHSAVHALSPLDNPTVADSVGTVLSNAANVAWAVTQNQMNELLGDDQADRQHDVADMVRDAILTQYCEDVSDYLVDMNVPGVKWIHLL